MGVQHSKAGTSEQEARSVSSKASRRGTAAAFRAVDVRSVNKLWKALSVGAAVGNVRRSTSHSAATTQSTSVSLLEYAVEKNFYSGVAIMLTVCVHHRLPVMYRTFSSTIRF